MLGRIRHHLFMLTMKTPAAINLGAELRDPLAQLLRQMAPHRAVGIARCRVGSRFDGGYVMLDDFTGLHAAFSLGIEGNVKWDLAMANKGLRIVQYDYTIDASPVPHPNFEFHKIKVGSPEEDTTPTRSLATLIAGQPAQDMILKIDIEGSEWDVFADIDPDRLKVFRQILIEFHELRRIAEPAWRKRAMTALEHLNRHHAVVHVHANNFSPIVQAGDIAVTNGLEVSYARRDAYELVPATETFPGPLDRPNNPYRPDVPLGTFTFTS